MTAGLGSEELMYDSVEGEKPSREQIITRNKKF